jgi:50S ribosomal protein L16 3-hydroxylase
MKKQTMDSPRGLLGGLTAKDFMSKHWQKKPLLVRNAFTDFKPIMNRQDLFELAKSADVESRLVVHSSDVPKGQSKWSLSQGPFRSKDFPKFTQKEWTLLVQGVNLHNDQAADILSHFDFIPRARLDDLMISYATDRGGVGPHFDRYDVFLLQAQGVRRWRIGKNKNHQLEPNVPLKILSNFNHTHEFLLNPGDMLYLPPQYAHEGVAMGECQTYSIGFKAPQAQELTQDLFSLMSETLADTPWLANPLYQDPHQAPTDLPGEIPVSLQYFAHQQFLKKACDSDLFREALGIHLTEPKAHVYFDSVHVTRGVQSILSRLKKGAPCFVRLARQSQMLFDEKRIYINGESLKASGFERTLLRKLANQKLLQSEDFKPFMDEKSVPRMRDLWELLHEWAEQGWVLIDFE